MHSPQKIVKGLLEQKFLLRFTIYLRRLISSSAHFILNRALILLLLIISIYSLIPDSKKPSLHVIFRSVVGSSEVWDQNMLLLVNICLIFAVKC